MKKVLAGRIQPAFYIAKSYVKANGSTTSTIVRKLGTLDQLLIEHGPTRDDVLAWAKNEVKIETEKYKKEKEAKTVLIPFHADRQLDYEKQVFFRGGYLFLQSIYYQMHMDKICRKLKLKYKLNRKMAVKSMEKAKNTDQTPSFKWDYLWTAMAFRLLFHSFPETQTNRHH